MTYRSTHWIVGAAGLVMGCGAATEGELGEETAGLADSAISCPTGAVCYAVTSASDSGKGSLRQAIKDANDGSGERYIKFDIPGPAPHVIEPVTVLPALDGGITLDGFSQPGARAATDSSGPEISIVISGDHAAPLGDGLVLSGDGNVVQGLAINGFDQGAGIAVLTSNHVIRGNLIGVGRRGRVGQPNLIGVQISNGAWYNLIGGPTLADRNVLSGNAESGLLIFGDANEVYGNAIGTSFDGTLALGNERHGVGVFGDRNAIGGMGDGEANIIAFNTGDGILIGLGDENALARNSVHDNGMRGIDLGGDGVTANDGLLDGDEGANRLQNFPKLTSATLDPTTEYDGKYKAEVDWRLKSEPNTKHRVEFFASSACNASGFGEGERSLGSRALNTDGSGLVENVWVLPGRVAPNEVITATATRLIKVGDVYLAEDTSEFSRCFSPSMGE